jgi:thiol-disulfide isomerase/thioredoxin
MGPLVRDPVPHRGTAMIVRSLRAPAGSLQREKSLLGRVCLAVACALCVGAGPACAEETTAAAPTSPSVVFFYQDGCPDCEKIAEVLDMLAGDLPEGAVVRYEIGDSTSSRLFRKLQKAYGIDVSSVPVVFVGDQVIAGASRAQEFALSDALTDCARTPCPSPLDRVPPDVFPWVDLLEAALLGSLVLLLALLQRP